jgi:thymidylate synthase (FAD)
MKFKSTVDVSVVQSMGGDHMVVAAAKVSTSSVEAMRFAPNMSSKLSIDGPGVHKADLQKITEDNAGLINYLMKHRHGTPFEHSAVTFYVHAPILVWREWHRHRVGFSYNEESGRYKTLEPVFYVPDRERPMMKIDDWKPGRPKFLRCEDDGEFQKLCERLQSSYKHAYEMYELNLAAGFDPGLARDCLPVAIYSGCWVTCNPRSLMSFLSLRVHDPEAKFVSYPLWEIDMAARVCEEALKAGWPITHAAFTANGRVAP